MPIINGITRDEGSYLLPPDSLEPVLKAGGNLSFGSTALGVELQEVSTVERLITSHYLGRCAWFFISRSGDNIQEVVWFLGRQPSCSG